MPTFKLFLFISVSSFAWFANASPKEDVNCIWAASEEVFRLMDLHEASVMRKFDDRIQIAVKMTAFDPRTGISTWSTCGFEKYNHENGAVTKLYSVQLNRKCEVLAHKETIRPRRDCPNGF